MKFGIKKMNFRNFKMFGTVIDHKTTKHKHQTIIPKRFETLEMISGKNPTQPCRSRVLTSSFGQLKIAKSTSNV